MLANAPTAVSQSPSKTFKTFLSAFISCVLIDDQLVLITQLNSSSLSLHCKAITPCPAQGMISEVEKV